MSLLEGLNDPQREATKFLSGAVLVLAGAGSGKTRVLTHRIAFLLRNGISARHILAVTFTNKAAQEMKERITGLVGDKAEKLWISTFHSACLRMLRRDIVVTGISRDFHVFDTDDQLKVMKEIIKQRDLSTQDHPPKRYIAQFDDAKNKGGTDEDCSDYLYDKYGEDAAILFEEYQKSLRRSNALDFNDLIVKLIRLWKEYPDTLYARQRQFQYVLIDEYQDTNPIQYELIRLLCQTRVQREKCRERERQKKSEISGDLYDDNISSQGLGNVMVVGDDDQSIYGFRGADVQNIFRFQEDFSPVHVIRLEQNYRSTGHILNAANSVIRNNASRMEKTMWTNADEGELVGLLTSRTMWDEAREVQREIEEIISGKLGTNAMGDLFQNNSSERYSYKDIAVIYRTNAYSLPFEQVFRRSATPHVLVGARKFYERSEVKDILAYLKLLINPSDEVSFTRAISTPKRGIGPKTIGQMVVISRRDNIPILDAALQWADGGTSKIKVATLNFCSLILRLRQSLRDGEAVSSLLEDLLQDSGYREMLEEGMRKELGEIRGQRNIRVGVGKSDSERQLENIKTLVEDISRFVQDFDEEKYIEDSLIEIEAMSEALYESPETTNIETENLETENPEINTDKLYKHQELQDESSLMKEEVTSDSNSSGNDSNPNVSTIKQDNSEQDNLEIDNWSALGPLFSRVQEAVVQNKKEENTKAEINKAEINEKEINKKEQKNKREEGHLQKDKIKEEVLEEQEDSTSTSTEKSVINRKIIQGLEERTSEKNVLWLRNFLDGTALASSVDSISDDQSSVTLMTAHLAKGLEFPIVFVVGMSEGNFPHFRSLESVDDIDEERRLVYVALTRAKKKLYVSYSQTSERWEAKSNTKREHALQPSRFLLEISSSCLERSVSLSRNYNNAERKRERQQKFAVRRSETIEGRYASTFSNRQSQLRKYNQKSTNRNASLQRGSKASKGSKRKPKMINTNTLSTKFTPLEGSYETRTPTSFEDFQEATRVHHEKFGHGVVLQKTGARNNPRLVIEFESWGQRTLLARVANLDLVIPT